MRLQKMHYILYDNDIEVVCAVGWGAGGEYTACGQAIPDSTLDVEQAEHIGDTYIGKLAEVTCEDCKDAIKYYKNLK